MDPTLMSAWEIASLGTPAETLVKASHSQDRFVLLEVARHANTPPGTLRRLAAHDDVAVATTAIKNANFPPDACADLAKHRNGKIRAAVAASSATPMPVLEELSRTTTKSVKAGLARNLRAIHAGLVDPQDTPWEIQVDSLLEETEESLLRAATTRPLKMVSRCAVIRLFELGFADEKELRAATTDNVGKRAAAHWMGLRAPEIAVLSNPGVFDLALKLREDDLVASAIRLGAPFTEDQLLSVARSKGMSHSCWEIASRSETFSLPLMMALAKAAPYTVHHYGYENIDESFESSQLGVIVEYIGNSGSTVVERNPALLLLARDPDIHVDVFNVMRASRNRHVRKAVVNSGRLSADELQIFASDRSEEVRAAVAAHALASTETLYRLGFDNSERVRKAAADNPRADDSVKVAAALLSR